MLQFVTSLSQGLNINTLCHYETVKTIAKYYYFSFGNNSSRWLIHLKAWKFHLNKWIYLIHAMMKPWNLWEPTANQEKTTRGLFLLRFLTMRTTAVYASISFYFLYHGGESKWNVMYMYVWQLLGGVREGPCLFMHK